MIQEQSMEKYEHLTSVGISFERLRGLQYKAKKTRPKTSTASLLDFILAKAGIEELSKEDFDKRVRDEDLE